MVGIKVSKSGVRVSKSSVMVFDLVTYSTDFVTDLVTFSSPNHDAKFLCLVLFFL